MKSHTFFLLMAGLASGPAGATTPSIWPVAGLYGFENTACNPKENARYTAMIAPELCGALQPAARLAAGNQFAASVKRHFPAVVERFAASLPSDASPRAKLASGLIASLRLTRATIWTVDKGSSVDAFLPVTLTLDITNPSTGEVVFTRTRSEVGQSVLAPGNFGTALAAQLPRQVSTMVEQLVSDAAAAWHPSTQIATVVGRAGEDWVIDRGAGDGLRTDASVGADGRVVFSGPDYAIIRPTLGTYKLGDHIERTSVSPASVVARPSVLTAITQIPAGYSTTYLTQIFEDALGSSSSLSPMPVNPGFSSLRGLVTGEAKAAAKDDRPLPDYVAAVAVTVLPSARLASNIEGVTIERHAAVALVSLVDRSGRVVRTVQGTGRIEDQVSGTMRFSLEQRTDTVIHNALLDAASKLESFKPTTLHLPVVASGGRFRIDDPAGMLPLGMQLTVLRPAGSVGKIKSVYYPVAELHSLEAGTGGVIATDEDVRAYEPRNGDVVAAEQSGTTLVSRQEVSRCLSDTSPRLDDRGTVRSNFASAAADALFPAGFAGPVRIWNLPPALDDLQSEFADWGKFIPAARATNTRCYLPVISVNRDEKSKGYALLAGYQLFDGSSKLGGSGLQSIMTPTRVAPSTAAPEEAAMLQQDLAAALVPLFERAGKALTPAR